MVFNYDGCEEKEKRAMENNVIVAVFKVESEGFQAFTELKQSAVGETYLVNAAALIKKEKDTCNILDGFDSGVSTKDDTAFGAAIGMLLGVIGGPIGILLGGSYGALIGMNVDAADSLYGVSMLEQIALKLDEGMVAIIALANEKSQDALDEKLSKFDTVIARFDAEAVADEVDEAYKIQDELARQARMKLRKEKKEDFREELEENAEILRENFTK